MAPGKLAAQAAHAARLSLLSYIKDHPSRLGEFISLGCCGTMVVLHAKNLRQIEETHARAVSAGLPAALFVDSGHIPTVAVPAGTDRSTEARRCANTNFDGGPMLTALAIGPAQRHEMRHLTKKFRCVP